MSEKAGLLTDESTGSFDQFDPLADISPPSYSQASHNNITIPLQNILPKSTMAAPIEVPPRQHLSEPPAGVEASHPMFPANPNSGTTAQHPMVYFFGTSQHGDQSQQFQHQQHPNVIFLTENSGPSGQYGQFGQVRSFFWPILISCFVLWLCGVFLGLIAFIVALFGREVAKQGDDRRARCCSKASYGISLLGLCLGVIALVVIGMFWYHSSSRSCPHGDYIYQNRRVCCGAVTCTHGIHLDSTGCLQCCDPYSKTECFKNGHFNDSHGCKICCSTSKDRCSSGFYYDSFGCTKCCSNSYSSSCSYGSYNDSTGCKVCCPSYDCSLNGQYKDANGCTKCCPYTYNTYPCTIYGHYFDSNNCKICCTSSNDNRGNCSCPSLDTCLFGTFRDSRGCPRCCSSFSNLACTTYGYYMDSDGCKQCCSPLSNYKVNCTCPSSSSSCPYGFRNITVGCNKCCNYYSSYDCMSTGFYYDSAGCKTCCNSPRYCSPWGFYYDSNNCKRCCTRSKSRNNITCAR